MTGEITEDQVVEAAGRLGGGEFTVADLAEALGASRIEVKDAFKAARKSGRLERIPTADDEQGRFRVAEAAGSAPEIAAEGESAQAITSESVIQAASALGDEFTRADIAGQLGVSSEDINDAFKAARQSGRLQPSGQTEAGKKLFRLEPDA